MTFLDRIGSASISLLLARYAYRLHHDLEPEFWDFYNIWIFGGFAAVKVVTAFALLWPSSSPVR